jgi:endonuclease YncB( thermonuclease family)
VYIVQIEDQEGYTVFLAFQEDKIASDVSQTIIFNWRSEKEGTYSVRTFVWSSLEDPIPVNSLVRELRIDVNDRNEVLCTGYAACFDGIVTRIVDGDTLDVGDTRIRLSLVDTPEIYEEGYDEAKSFTSALCPVNSRVIVDQDDRQPQDSFGRMLAKVTCADNKILNAELLYNGHAMILEEYCAESEFSGEDWAQEYGCADETEEQIPASNTDPIADAGPSQTVNEGTSVMLDGRNSSDPDANSLSYSWKQTAGPFIILKNDNTATPTFTAPSVSSQTTLAFSLTVSDGELTSTDTVYVIVNDIPAASPPPTVDEIECDPSYPTVCIPPPPPDLDCDEIPYNNFKVLPPDPHRFDRDKDGIGCET